jgi:DNA ligase-1
MSNSLFKFDLPTLYARASDGKTVLEWNVEVEGNKYRMITGQQGGNKVTSKWTVCESKNVGKKHQTTPEQQAEAEAMSKWKDKLKTGGYWEDIKEIDKGYRFIKPMLAYPLISEKTKKDKDGKAYTHIEDRTPKVRLPVMVDRKYNGMRQVVSTMGPYTREGEPILSAPHIWQTLESMFQTFPKLVLDGELYNHDYRHKLNELIKIVRKTSLKELTPELLAKSERIVKYYVYDAYGFTVDGVEITENTPCRERRDALHKFLTGIKYIVPVPYLMAYTIEEAKRLFEDFIEDGYEGAILRNADAPYQHERTDDLIKLKPFDDMEVLILGFVDPGSGNWGGTAKTVSVQDSKGQKFEATMKGDFETVKQILGEQDKWVGQTVTMTYCGFTGKGIPNHGQINPFNCMVGDRKGIQRR